ncbi:MAG: tRNA pseudouridine(55) synthase [Cytophagales bacterium]|jgi:tRNA pseudouridine55 synthase|nr:tRNA pseudouridine(55) synthase TruB [Bacteroidota bacterium]MBS1981637.1 tRNA pseudouridine(55) synthase TruB [Bacteroidota bacterium]WHZ08947.1 MAG: tRNA pseudouridine(55) synthase [Cytophagales bacterium]
MESEGQVLLINKPLEWTSFDVVNKLRYKLKIKKIGHAGTLDPLATGLLIICTGKMTKRIDEYQAQEKEYTGKFVLGQSTPSHDLETAVSEPHDISNITEENIRAAIKKFVGPILQIPPQHSAIRINGKRAYELARKGKEAELKPREILIKEFEITSVNIPVVAFRVVCSKGTYIRSLARDFGQALGTVAYLAELCRTRIGAFKLEEAISVNEVPAVTLPIS